MIKNCNFQDFRNHHGSMVDIDFEFHAKDVPAGIADGAIEAIDEFKFRMTAPDRESPKAEKAVEKCEEYSPLPAPVAEKLKKKLNPPEQKPGAKKLERPAKKPDALAAQNKWQIPFSSMTQISEYQNARNLCRKYKKPYPEALKLKEKEDREWREKHPGKTTPSEQASINARAGKKKKAPVPGGVNPVHEPITPQQNEEEHLPPPSDDESLSPPPVPPGQEEKQVARAEGLMPGQKVRHNGSSSSPFFRQDGEIIKTLPDGEVLVKFGKSEVKLPTFVLLPHIHTNRQV